MKLRNKLAAVVSGLAVAVVGFAIPASAATEHYLEFDNGNYCLNWPGAGNTVKTAAIGSCGQYQPINAVTHGVATYYEWEAGTTGQCITWQNNDFYLANCSQFPLSQQFNYNNIWSGELVNYEATQSLGRGTIIYSITVGNGVGNTPYAGNAAYATQFTTPDV